MPWIRTIKPEFFRHEQLYEMEKTLKLPLRLGCAGLILCANRDGCFRWQPQVLKLDVLPYDKIDFEKILNGLADCEIIAKYTVDNKDYGYFINWHSHQNIHQNEAKSRIPVCDAALQASTQAFSAKTKVNNVPKAEKSAPIVDATQKSANKVDVASTKLSIIEKIFSHWQIVMSHPSAILDAKRRQLIQKALDIGYSEQAICQAINGCSKTPHNMGDNDRGQRYDGLHIILRDADQIDRFITNDQNPPHTRNASKARSAQNVDSLQEWIDSSHHNINEGGDPNAQ